MDVDQKFRGKSETELELAKKDALLNRLINHWRDSAIPTFYQRCYLSYLNNVPADVVEDQIKNQIKLTIEGKSISFEIQRCITFRQHILRKTSQCVSSVQNSSEKTEKDIKNICLLIDQLRSANLHLAQSILSLHKSLTESVECTSLDPYNELLERINKDNSFLKASFMRKYIMFSSGYDPFFLHHYEHLKKTYDHRLRQFKSIEQLFTMGIGLSFKLMKTQEQISQLLSGKQKKYSSSTFKSMKVKRFSYKLVEGAESQSTNLPSLKLENQTYFKKADTKLPQKPLGEENVQEYRAFKSGNWDQPQQLSSPQHFRKYSYNQSLNQYESLAHPKFPVDKQEGQYESRIQNYTPNSLSSENRFFKSSNRSDFIGKLIRLGRHKSTFRRENDSEDENLSRQVQRYGKKDRQKTLNNPHLSLQILDETSARFHQSLPKRKDFKSQQEKSKKVETQGLPLIPKTKRRRTVQDGQQEEKKNAARLQTIEEQMKQKEAFIEETVSKILKEKETSVKKEENKKSNQNSPRKKKLQTDLIQVIQIKDMKIPEETVISPEKKSPSKNSPNIERTIQQIAPPQFPVVGQQQAPAEIVKTKAVRSSPKRPEAKKEVIFEQNQMEKSSLPSLPKMVLQEGRRREGFQLTETLSEQLLQGSSTRSFKLKAGNFHIQEIFGFLSQLQIQEDYRKIFQIRNWESSVEHNQYYVHKFYVNELLTAIAMCCAVPEGDIVVKYWGPIKGKCPQQLSVYLFGKYLQHIEKSSLCRRIYYNALEIHEILQNGFKKHKERIYQRDRLISFKMDPRSYSPFLSLEFLSIAVSRKYEKHRILTPHHYERFLDQSFVSMNYLLMIGQFANSGLHKAFMTYNPKMKTMTAINAKLADMHITDSPFENKSQVPEMSLMAIKTSIPIKSAFFRASDTYFKLFGTELYIDEARLIVSVDLLKYNAKIYFARGFETLNETIKTKKNAEEGEGQKIQFSVRMFSKIIRGRLASLEQIEQACFGHFSLDWKWKDFLKGRIEHSMDCESFDETFHVLFQIDKELLFAFTVTPKDHTL